MYNRVSLQLSVPSSINLLPGQIHMLKEAVEKEKERIKNVSPPAAPSHSPNISLRTDMPASVFMKYHPDWRMIIKYNVVSHFDRVCDATCFISFKLTQRARMLMSDSVLSVSLQLFLQCVSAGGRAAARERSKERKPAAEARQCRKLLCSHHQTGSWWVYTTIQCTDIIYVCVHYTHVYNEGCRTESLLFRIASYHFREWSTLLCHQSLEYAKLIISPH